MLASAVIPFIDTHCHLHGLPHDAWETVGATGIAAAILSAGNPHDRREVHQEVPDAEELLRIWEHPIRLAPWTEKKHLFRVFVAVGISSMTRVANWERALELMPEYLRRPGVVAVGEAGLDPVQYFGMQWPLDEQKVVLAEQLRLARELDLPFIMHTPKVKKQSEYLQQLTPSELPADGYKRHYLDLDLAIVERAGFDQRRLVIDHVDASVIAFVLEETEAYIGIRVGQIPTTTPPQYFADVVEKYGPERLMINTDHIAYSSHDLLAIPRTIREMLRRGIGRATIQRVVFDNANEFFRLGL